MKEEDFGKIKKVLLPSLVGAGISLGVLAALLFIVTAVLYKTTDPCKLTDAVSVFILIVPSFLSGMIGTKRSDSLLGGIFAGVILTLLIITVSLFFENVGGSVLASQMPYRIAVRLLGIFAAFLGALLSTHLNNKNRNKKIGVRMPKIKKYR